MTREDWLAALSRPERHEYTRCSLDDLCERCLLLWLDRKPPPCLCGDRNCGDGWDWRDFEPARCEVVAAGNGFRAVTNAPESTNGAESDKDSRRTK